jgi:hypothetical protein
VVEEMNPEARRLVQLARQARTPTPEDKRRVRAALGFGIAATAASAPTGAAAAAVKAFGVGAAARIALTAIVIGSVGAGAFYSTRAAMHSRAQARSSAAAAEAREPLRVLEPHSSPTTQPAVVEAIDAPAQGTPDAVSLEARPHAAPAPQDPLLVELTLLHRAQKAWQDGKPQLALDLVQRHSHMYPHSQLALERDAVRVFALCALGRTAEASSLASELLGKAPRSPLRTSIEESCAMRAPK